ncbi:MAG: hypothetical protein DME49_05330 [Verrucomicrobia bacterium]|jgi:uncharacterized membrane protein|nr:MAG: hypothetical protein DME49_05330 [Verrucomicrobiota bacterium]PYK92683.1 MAG: hypothetical protein DME36_12470 [Verrucomicrobiota bacterium]
MTAARFQIILSAIAAVISLAGLADATYLTVAHLTGDDLVCGSPGGCSAVLGSVYASVAGIPTAAFGALAYFVAFSSATLAVFGYARARTLLMLVVMAMFGATLWLLYVQAFILHAFCPFCLLSAALTFLLAGIVVATPSSD